jgi:hypothetical protein
LSGIYLIEHQRGGLGRHVNHDPQSRRYPYVRRATRPTWPPAVRHERHIPIFDQGDLGACTGMAGLGILGHGPYWAALQAATELRDPTHAGPFPLNEGGALALYSANTQIDPYQGAYPPDDTGSDGLSAAKSLMAAGVVPGFEWAFGTDEALTALASFPLLVGTLWAESMFEVNRSGLMRVEGAIVGGHEWIVDEYVPSREWVGGVSSWGQGFGVDGRFYLTVEDFARLLEHDGDVIVLTPPTAPAPEPLPEPEPGINPDMELLRAFEAWKAAKGL